MRLFNHMPYRIYCFVALLMFCGCYSPGNQSSSKRSKDPFIFKETIVTGKDTAMNSAAGFQKINISDILCQHWELAGMSDISSIELVMDEKNLRIYPELALFKDSGVVQNPRSHFRTGKWRLRKSDEGPVLMLSFNGKKQEEYLIQHIGAHRLSLACKGKKDSLYISLTSDALNHQNMYNDPFHPVNNQWRIKPAHAENDSAIKQRVKQCIRFYALYYRDNIKRNKDNISFLGLPHIFEWYHRGIGLPDRDKIDDSWFSCFYNKEQAMKGYDILRDLIVQYEFVWPDNAPVWVYETHSVLEQMYHKL